MDFGDFQMDYSQKIDEQIDISKYQMNIGCWNSSQMSFNGDKLTRWIQY